ncbi:flagellar motor protein MotB [Dyella sp. A6]|uniref:flagellar motor protein MotB n=1 Tax=Dyella aluminiiresistens TaxID=3069105 RepID=UPI002E7703DF|nr:flagellar motor protein MotB [Dyella sp. A6]
MEDDKQVQVVIRRARRKANHHHGGAWKVAYADFVTAMMAFFLVMWLLGIGSRQQRAAISAYFKNPSMTPGQATVAPPGMLGPGGASDSMIKLGGAMDLPHGPGKDLHASRKISKAQAEQVAREQEKARLEQLMQQLHAAILNSQALAPFKDQLLIDISPQGLRIQIVDKQNRPMFDTGSATLKPYTVAILHELAGFINQAPNKISIAGHTDDAPYSGQGGYSNWELSADRANAARRALLAGGMKPDKVASVVGLADSVPFDKADPGSPTNRRISIVLLTRKAQDAAVTQEGGTAAVPQQPAASSQPAVPPPAAPAAQPPTQSPAQPPSGVPTVTVTAAPL